MVCAAVWDARQSVGLAVLVKASVLTASGGLDVGSIQVGLQDFIVCIEMFIAAAVHKASARTSTQHSTRSPLLPRRRRPRSPLLAPLSHLYPLLQYTFGWETYANGTMKLLMDQRAMYLAEMSYKRAQEEQKKEEERLLKEERRRMGLDTDDEDDLHKQVGEGEPLKKKKKRGKGKGKRKGSKAAKAIDTSHPQLTRGKVAIDISPGSDADLPRTPVLEPALFTGDDDDDALVDDEVLTRSQRGRRDLFKAPPSLTLHSPRAAAPASPSPSSSSSSLTSTSAASAGRAATAPHAPFLSHIRRNSAGQSALHLLEGGARGLIGSARSVLLPVSSFFVNEDDDALFDEEADGKKPILLTQSMRREIEEKVRQEAAEKEERRRHRKSSAGGGAADSAEHLHAKRRTGDYETLSTDDRDDAGVEMQETKERGEVNPFDDDGL